MPLPLHPHPDNLPPSPHTEKHSTMITPHVLNKPIRCAWLARGYVVQGSGEDLTPRPAMANIRNMHIAAFRVETPITQDTGTPVDLATTTSAGMFRPHWVKVPEKLFDIANNTTLASVILPARLRCLDDDTLEFYLMKNSPTVMSVGKRIRRGFTSIWLPEKIPVTVTPARTIIPLDVIDDVPYICAYGLHTTLTDPREIRLKCGVSIDGDGCIQFQTTHNKPTAPVIRHQSRHVPDTSTQTETTTSEPLYVARSGTLP